MVILTDEEYRNVVYCVRCHSQYDEIEIIQKTYKLVVFFLNYLKIMIPEYLAENICI